jgi:hypothetical protein
MFGSDIMTNETGLNEECERELESERELEKEMEQEVPRQLPVKEIHWDFRTVFTAESPWMLPREAGVMHLNQAIAMKLPEKLNLKKIKWSMKICMTKNFINTVFDKNSAKDLHDLSQFLRPVDAVIRFGKDGSYLLLSEYEADKVLALAWKQKKTYSGLQSSNGNIQTHAGSLNSLCAKLDLRLGDFNTFTNFSLHKSEIDKMEKLNLKQVNISLDQELSLASLQLLNGETMFATNGRKNAVETMLILKEAKSAALNFPAFRATQQFLSRSDLETICSSDFS